MMNAPTSLNGDMADVSAFFGISLRTVKRWCAESPPRIAFYKEGRRVIFSESAIVEYWCAAYRASRRLAPGEAMATATREWRNHLGLKAGNAGQSAEERLSRLEHRVRALEEVESQKAAA